MKHFLFFAVAAIGLSLGNQSAQARSWRIHSNANVKPDFTSINEAMSNIDVRPGDTLYLEPGCALTGTHTINKRVVIIGPGYNLSDAGASTAVLSGNTDLVAVGVKIEGCIIDNLHKTQKDCIIERCKIGCIPNSYAHSQCTILSCYVTGHISMCSGNSNTISNCIIRSYLWKTSFSTISNNIIIAGRTEPILRDVTNSTITNNIILNTNPDYQYDANENPYFYKNYTIENNTLGSGNIITNNILSTDAEHAFHDYPNNKFIGATPEDIFVMEGIGEEIYRLKEGSPAIGYGTGGYDCGAFSGAFPYVLSGRPRYIPYIYDAVIPNQPTDGKLNVTLKIKSQNE